MHKLALLTATAAMALWAGAAQANVVLSEYTQPVSGLWNTKFEQNTNPRYLQHGTITNKLGPDQSTAYTGFDVRYTTVSPYPRLTVPGAGNAYLDAAGDTIKNVTISLYDKQGANATQYFFHDIYLDAQKTGNLSISVVDNFGTTQNFALGAEPGQNKFSLTAIDDQMIKSVTITGDMDQLKQVYFSEPIVPVPLPAALPMFLAALAGLGLVSRRPS